MGEIVCFYLWIGSTDVDFLAGSSITNVAFRWAFNFRTFWLFVNRNIFIEDLFFTHISMLCPFPDILDILCRMCAYYLFPCASWMWMVDGICTLIFFLCTCICSFPPMHVTIGELLHMLSSANGSTYGFIILVWLTVRTVKLGYEFFICWYLMFLLACGISFMLGRE